MRLEPTLSICSSTYRPPLRLAVTTSTIDALATRMPIVLSSVRILWAESVSTAIFQVSPGSLSWSCLNTSVNVLLSIERQQNSEDHHQDRPDLAEHLLPVRLDFGQAPRQRHADPR